MRNVQNYSLRGEFKHMEDERRKELLKSDTEYEVVLIDATETPVERPQKNKESITQERKKDIH